MLNNRLQKDIVTTITLTTIAFVVILLKVNATRMKIKPKHQIQMHKHWNIKASSVLAFVQYIRL